MCVFIRIYIYDEFASPYIYIIQDCVCVCVPHFSHVLHTHRTIKLTLPVFNNIYGFGQCYGTLDTKSLI